MSGSAKPNRLTSLFQRGEQALSRLKLAKAHRPGMGYYKYLKNDEIRLLVILPGANDDIIHCELETVKVAKAARYNLP